MSAALAVARSLASTLISSTRSRMSTVRTSAFLGMEAVSSPRSRPPKPASARPPTRGPAQTVLHCEDAACSRHGPTLSALDTASQAAEAVAPAGYAHSMEITHGMPPEPTALELLADDAGVDYYDV